MIDDLVKSWLYLWKCYFSKPSIRLGEEGFFKLNGYMIFMERVK